MQPAVEGMGAVSVTAVPTETSPSGKSATGAAIAEPRHIDAFIFTPVSEFSPI